MIIKNKRQLQEYQAVAQLSCKILHQLHQAIKPGVTPLQIDELAERLCQEHQARPSFKGVGPVNNAYQHATCVSVNNTVVHGIPNKTRFQPGDVISVDFGLIKDGLQTDHCFTLGLAPLKAEDERLIKVAREAVLAGVKWAKVGSTTGDIGFAIQAIVEQAGFNVAKEFIGHGIGQQMHEGPELPAYGRPGYGERLKPGMVLCVEAQVLAGSDQVRFNKDGWTVTTADGKNSAMFEYMVVVGKDKPEILTPTMGWEMVR